jgi:O-antigen/teichoic acid export membrane protein
MLSSGLQVEPVNRPIFHLLNKAHVLTKRHAAQYVAFLEAGGSAAINFAISIFIARSFDAETFSGYITALSAAFVMIAFIRISFTTPCAVKPNHWYLRRLKALAAIHVTACLIAVLVTTLLLVTMATVLRSPLWIVAAASAPGVCLWFVGYEFERSLLIKQGRYLRLMTLGFLQGLALLLVLIPLHHLKLPYETLIVAMALLGIARTLATISVIGFPDWRSGVLQLRLGLRKLGMGAAAYLLGGVACSHAPVFALSLFALPEQAAAFAAMRTLYQPVQIFFRSRDVVVQTRFYADRSTDKHSLYTQYWKSIRRTALLSILLTGILVVVGPWFVHIVYAGRYDNHMVTFWLWAAIMLMINLAAITDAYISYAQMQNSYAYTQVGAGLCTIALSLFMSSHYADAGAAVAAVIGWLTIVGGGSLLIRKHASVGKVPPT